MPTDLNPNAKAWVAALRSGDYKQGHEYLKRTVYGEPLFCCLGVACELFAKAHPDTAKWVPLALVERVQALWVEGAVEGESSELPPQVCEWLGLAELRSDLRRLDEQFHNQGVTFYNSHEETTLIRLNDRELLTFDEIADTIETHQKELFNAE